MNLDGKNIPDAERMALMANIESEGDRVFAQAVEQLDQARFAKVMRMNAVTYGRLSDVEKRNYLRWAEGFARVFSEKVSMMKRNSKPDPETPAVYRTQGAL